jgi:hypothetical protein
MFTDDVARMLTVLVATITHMLLVIAPNKSLDNKGMCPLDIV